MDYYFFIYIMSVSLGASHSVFLVQVSYTGPVALIELGAGGSGSPQLLGTWKDFSCCSKSLRT